MLIAELPHRAVLEIEGKEKASFLQGLISNDIYLVTPKQAIYAALLSSQGRFLYDFFIIERDDLFLLYVEAARREELLARVLWGILNPTLQPRSMTFIALN